ncbi:MAG: glycosyltransferase family 4 protein [Chloroflexi bacterium]|nr:glycosyltransferase family 4 protein [Chloroflexota bacterium]
MSHRINVLQLIASSHGGGASHVYDLAAMLPKDQFQVTVAMPEDGGNVSAAEIEATGTNFTAVSINQGFQWQEIQKIRALLKAKSIELLHVHGARAGLYGRLAVIGLSKRPKLLFSIHGFATPYYNLPKKLVYLIIEFLLQRITNGTICVAQAEANLFLKYRLTNPSKIHTINPGIPLERFIMTPDITQLRESLQVTDAPIILTICRLHIPRDFKTLLTAVKNIQRTVPNTNLLIVGDGPMRATIEQQIETLGLTKQVKLLGFRRDIPDLLQLADIFTLTSTGWEGFPISTLEAQAMGCPVIISDAGGSSEAVLHNQTGLIVPKNDVAALEHAFLTLLTNDELRSKLGHQGEIRARQSFSRNEMIKRITAVYKKL